MSLCSVTNCGRPSRSTKITLCHTHYMQVYRTGRLCESVQGRSKLQGDSLKSCLDCSRFLTLSEFHRNTKCLAGRSSRCKDCTSDYRRLTYKPKSLQALEKEHLRRAMLRGGLARSVNIQTLRASQGDKCFYCKIDMDFDVMRGYNAKRASIEHVLPLARGGYHTPDNVVLACLGCNLSKNDKTVEEYEVWL